MDVEQRGDDLQVVLHAVVDLADQPALALERLGHLPLRFLDPLDRAVEGVAQLLDLGRRPESLGQVELLVARLVGDDRAP